MTVQYAKIYYGPYESFHTLSHKPQKLRGLRAFPKNIDHLHQLGFRVDLVPVEFQNYCMIEICGYEVFRCNIKNLCFNTPAEEDIICRRAINAAIAASAKLTTARIYLWLWSLVEELAFRHDDFAPKNAFIADLDVKRVIKPPQRFVCCASCEEEGKKGW